MLFILSGGSCAGNGLRATVALSHMKHVVTGWLGLCILALHLLQHPTEYIYLRYSHNLERVPKFPDLISSLVGPAGGQGFGLRCSADCNADGGACIFHRGPWQERCLREGKTCRKRSLYFLIRHLNAGLSWQGEKWNAVCFLLPLQDRCFQSFTFLPATLLYCHFSLPYIYS